ncbi:MAG: 23S rRNA (pseudouridine(1915)-N(3))-methyltransferase RlmH [Myxococcota bacterium]
MILRLVHPARSLSGPLDTAARDYQKRISRHLRVDEHFVKPARIKSEDAASVRGAILQEGERILATVGPRDILVALEVTGASESSEALAKRMDGWMNSGARAIVFALGGPWGLSDAVRERARISLSLGPLTLPHELARVVLWEQLYRAGTILRGEPYHK